MRFFGSSGIRGVANIEVTPLFAQKLGAALATIYEGGEFIVGKDNRITGPILEAALSAGLVSCGGDIKLVNIIPTPVIAWFTRETKANAGVAISASHNPPKYNGFKVFNGNGMSLTEKEQRPVEELLEGGELDYALWDGVGSSVDTDATWLYIDALQENLVLDKEWKVACDLYCGAASTIAADTFEVMGLCASMINSHPDGHFPAGNPEPTIENLARLGTYLEATGSEIGFGFDGDADRMMAADEKGTPVSGDQLLAAYAGYSVKKAGKGVVVTHVGTSMCIEDMVEAVGGKVIRVRVGDAYITEEIERRHAVFGGEPIGAWVHPEVHMCPDGILSALKLLKALEENEQTLSEFVGDVPIYPTKSVKIEVKDREKTMIAVGKSYEKVFPDFESVNQVDGVRLKLPEGWILVRASGTEPLIRLTAEGRDEKTTKNLIERGCTLVKGASK